MITVIIIGGGFCGTLTAYNLLKHKKNISVILVNPTLQIGKGVAYSTLSDEHLLNVPAGKMSAYESLPNHFIDWIKNKTDFTNYTSEDLPNQFIPRRIYGKYLQEITEQIYKNKNIEIVNSVAIGLTPIKNIYQVQLSSGALLQANSVVLAMGNYLPANPKIKNFNFFNSRNYFQNPWNENYINSTNNKKRILLIGSGLTMIDCVLTLLKNNFVGEIIAVSPKGFTPASHTRHTEYPDFYFEIRNKTLNEIFLTVRHHLGLAGKNNIPWQAVINVIRPHTQEIWKSLSDKDKQQFISHLRHLWGVARHRLPTEISDKISKLIARKQLQIIGGRITEMVEENNKIHVFINERKTKHKLILNVDKVINCTGPQLNFNELKNELIQNLISKNLICSHKLKLGINALPNGQVLNKENNFSNNIFALGSLLRGVLWETTAIPEIRKQTENIANQIIENLNND